jgi:hypothetical protein
MLRTPHKINRASVDAHTKNAKTPGQVFNVVLHVRGKFLRQVADSDVTKIGESSSDFRKHRIWHGHHECLRNSKNTTLAYPQIHIPK